jgi:processive 1,2-diacylglycerol beta-glucosyltransferase
LAQDLATACEDFAVISSSPADLKAIVLYACSGSLGHKTLAENYATHLRAFGIDAVAVDVLQVDSYPTFSTFASVYFWVLKFLPGVWRWCYQHWPKLPLVNSIRLRLLPRRFKQTRKLLCSSRWDLIISTHPVSSGIVNDLKRNHHVEAPLWIAFSDWHVQPFWIFPEADRYLVPLTEQRNALELLGIPKRKIDVLGMLLSPKYYLTNLQLNDQSSFSNKNRPTSIVLVAGGKGWQLESVLQQLHTLNAKLIVISGSKERKKELEEFLKARRCPSSWKVVGFVNPIELMAQADLIITKPGGLSSAEVLQLGRPLLLLCGMPGHEEENARVLSRHGVCWLERLNELPGTLAHFMSVGFPTNPSRVQFRRSPDLFRKVIADEFSI